MMKGQSKERVLKQSQGRENNAKRWGKGYQFEAQETSAKGGKNSADKQVRSAGKILLLKRAGKTMQSAKENQCMHITLAKPLFGG